MNSNMAITRLVYILSVLVVLILHKVLASAEVAPREPDSMLSSEVENNKQIVDEPAVKETKHLKSDSKAVMTSFSEYYGISGSFIHGFIATFCMIIVSELGDKTFFIAAIMAMRHPRLTVLSGAMLALAVMHVMSALFGALALNIIPRAYTYYISGILFAIFGIKNTRLFKIN